MLTIFVSLRQFRVPKQSVQVWKVNSHFDISGARSRISNHRLDQKVATTYTYSCLVGALESLAREAAPGRRPTLSGKTVRSTGVAPPQCARQFLAPTIVERPSGRSSDGWRASANVRQIRLKPKDEGIHPRTVFCIGCIYLHC